MPSTTLEDAQAHLAVWISKLKPGEELQITQQDRTIARLTAVPAPPDQPRQPGSAKGVLSILEDDLAETYKAQMESALEAGWNNPLMDEYDNYDAHREQA
jgi:antitoxin (DNA-binding transcriptional repressor) of toxin-antitoxin stability system